MSTLIQSGSTCSGPTYLFKISRIRLEYLMLYNCQLSTLGIVTWSYNYFLMIIISDMKPYNCVQTNDTYRI